jgi:diacylglycerol kinase (ATP)
MRLAPDADLTDGLLDVTVVGPIWRWDLEKIKPRVYTGTHLEHPAVSTRRGRVVRLASAGQLAYADGERVGTLPVTAECVPKALRILVPHAEPARTPASAEAGPVRA